MAKAVRWRIPFASLSGTQYEIEIYDEGWTGATIELRAGSVPFVTDEDATDDFFAPIRTQTGTLQVCTEIPSGGTLRLEDILPANNIARPVQLRSLADDVVEWQGFLSCEAYSQDYTSIPQVLDISVISVLEAMDSVEVEMKDSMMFNSIIAHILYAMQTITDKVGMSLFDNIITPSYCQDAIITKYFYNNVYFTADQVVSGEDIVVEVHSISCKEILAQVAQFFGCCWREIGTDIYMEVIGENSGYTSFAYTSFADKYLNGVGTSVASPRSVVTSELVNSKWMGKDHEKSVVQGMRRVKVSTSLKDFECDIELQDCPYGSLVENPGDRQKAWGEVHANTNDKFYSLATFKSWYNKVDVALADNPNGKAVTISRGSSSSTPKYNKTVFWESDEMRERYDELFEVVGSGQTLVGDTYHYVTSYMAYMRLVSGELDGDDNPISTLTSGLMLCGLPLWFWVSFNNGLPTTWYTFTKDDYIYKQSSPMLFKAYNGKFILDIGIGAVSVEHETLQKNGYPLNADYNTRGALGITMAIQWGDRWLRYTDMNGNRLWVWNTSFATIDLNEKDAGCESMKMHYEIPCPQIDGVVTVYIYPKLHGQLTSEYQPVMEMFLTNLSLKYEPEDQELLSDRSENAYTVDTDKAFRDVAEISLMLASDAHNNKLATMIYDSSAEPVSLIQLGNSTEVRPEIDLLHRMRDYYQSARTTLRVEVAHPTDAPLPLLRLNGINDGKQYLPMAESRDWQMEKSTITCMEIPNN